MALTETILQYPSSGQTYGMYPVYNGLPFVVSANRTNRTNFKYVADIYVNSTKVTTLKHNKDITNNDYGIFDIGRVVENFITTSTSNFATYGWAGNTESYKPYQVKFGAEYERYIEISTITNNAGYCQVTFVNSEHDFRVGDGIVIQNSDVAIYNGEWIVSLVSTSYVRINKTFVSTGTGGLAIEAERFTDNYWYANPGTNGIVGFTVINTRPTRINIGDIVVVKQSAGASHAGYNGEWLVVDKVPYGSYTAIITNCPYITSTPVNGGVIYSKSKYNYVEQVNSTEEYTWDAGLQYEDINNFNITDYSMNVTDLGKFLTNAPNNQYIRLDEIGTLSCFNTAVVGSSGLYRSVFKSYTSNGTLIDTFNDKIGASTNVWVRLELGTGTKNMAGNLDLTGAAYYTVHIEDNSNNRLSEVRTYTIDYDCTRYTPKRFKWKNRLGGWDFFTFNLRSDRTVNIEKSTFRKAQKTWHTSSVGYGTAVGERGNTVYNVNANDSELVFSDWLSNDEAAWLEELWTSPSVFVMDANGTNELPIIITDNQLTIGERENRGLISYAINYTNSYNKVIQRG